MLQQFTGFQFNVHFNTTDVVRNHVFVLHHLHCHLPCSPSALAMVSSNWQSLFCSMSIVDLPNPWSEIINNNKCTGFHTLTRFKLLISAMSICQARLLLFSFHFPPNLPHLQNSPLYPELTSPWSTTNLRSQRTVFPLEDSQLVALGNSSSIDCNSSANLAIK